MNPRLSIIIPTKNEEIILKEMLSALDGLTIPHEIIVSDGKSTDRTAAIARAHGARVVEYTGTTRQTIGQGRNDGAKVATGDIFLFLDADTFIMNPNEFFAHALRHFEESPALVLLAVNIRVLPHLATLPDRIVYFFVNWTIRFQNNVMHRGASQGEFQMMRREAFRKIGGYNEALAVAEDLDLTLRLSKVGTTIFDPSLTAYHTGRRAHKVGWPYLLSSWLLNSFFFIIRGRPIAQEWKVIR